jgi:hypothetical protein
MDLLLYDEKNSQIYLFSLIIWINLLITSIFSFCDIFSFDKYSKNNGMLFIEFNSSMISPLSFVLNINDKGFLFLFSCSSEIKKIMKYY